MTRGMSASLVAGGVACLVALAAQGCSLAEVESMAGVQPGVSGEIVVRWADGEETALRPEACLSGDRANFRGADLVSPPYVLRVVAEPLEGLGVAVLGREGARPVFRSSSCAELRGDVQRSGWRVNDVWDVSGYLEADCRLASGEELHGRVTFEHCH
jgi:hypothetical protein